MSSRELTEWEAYEAVEGPIGDGRLDHLFAMLASVIANVNRGKGQRPYQAEQFMPKWERRRTVKNEAMSSEDMLRAVKRAHKAMGGS
jgi:hypothetical protein